MNCLDSQPVAANTTCCFTVCASLSKKPPVQVRWSLNELLSKPVQRKSQTYPMRKAFNAPYCRNAVRLRLKHGHCSTHANLVSGSSHFLFLFFTFLFTSSPPPAVVTARKAIKPFYKESSKGYKHNTMVVAVVWFTGSVVSIVLSRIVIYCR